MPLLVFTTIWFVFVVGKGAGKIALHIMQIFQHPYVEKVQKSFAEKKQDGLISDSTFNSIFLSDPGPIIVYACH